MSEAWSQWQGQLIDGKFHLKQYLGGSRHSGVFLAQLSIDAARGQSTETPFAIRLIADSPNPELQLSRWRMAQDVSHPHLLWILETGRCHLGVIDLIYVVMEYGEENLGQIVPQRPLTAYEAREMLEPTLEAITYLHSRGLIHGHLKPANILAVNDQLKLTADGICPDDQPVLPSALDAAHDVYDAPESSDGSWSPAADVWSLGMTLAEVLTQHLPSNNGDLDSDPLLPANIPVEFVEIVRGCLRRDLQLRWNIAAIKSRLQNLTVAPPAGPQTQTEMRPDVADQDQRSEAVTAATAQPLPSAQTTPAAAPQPTFSQALRAKPVASEKSMQVPLARAAAAGVGANPDATMSTVTVEPAIEHSTQTETISVSRASTPESWTYIPDRRLASRRATDSTQTQASDSQNQIHPMEEQSARPRLIDDEKPSAMSAFIARVSAFRTQTLPKVQRFTSQTRDVVQRAALRTREWLQKTIERAEELLGPYPSRKLQSLGVLAMVVFAAAAAIYASFGLLRHKQISKTTHESTTSPKVVIAHPQQKAGQQRRNSKSPAKPQPGTPLTRSGSGSQASTTQAAPAQSQSPSVPAAQPAAGRQQATQAADRQSSVRRIDDGGADEEAAAPLAMRTPSLNTNSNAASLNGVQQVLPQVSRSALNTIRGTVRVSIKVRLDRSGNVAGAELESSGPSRYFARKSLEAAQSWKFAPGQTAGSPLLLHFEFTNNGARAFATKVGS